MRVYGSSARLFSWSALVGAEAEYRAVDNAVAEATWLRQLLSELHTPLRKTTLVYCDNISTVYMSSNSVQHQRTKHVEIDLHFVRERVTLGDSVYGSNARLFSRPALVGLVREMRGVER